MNEYILERCSQVTHVHLKTRQCHNLKHYNALSKIPNCDTTSLPFWEIHESEGKLLPS
jgi:hypothetical protein